MSIVYSRGTHVQRLFAGEIATEDDIRKFVHEMREELKGGTIFCEIWRSTDKEVSTFNSLSEEEVVSLV